MLDNVLCSFAWCESNGDLPIALQHGIIYQVDAINDITFNMMVLKLFLIIVPNMYSTFFMDHSSALGLNF